MSIPYNPSILSADSAGGTAHFRRLMMNPPEEFVQSAAAQTAIAAGRAPAPFSDGPVVIGPDGQAVMTPPPDGQAVGSWDQPQDQGAWQDPGTPGSGVHYASGMGMGVESHDQQGLDDGWMQQIQGQLAAGQPPSQSPQQAPNTEQGQQNQDQQVGIMTAPATPTAPMESMATATAASSVAAASVTSAVTATSTMVSASPSIRTSSMAPPMSSVAASLSSSVSSAIAAATESAAAAPHKPFTKSTAFILIIVLCSLALFGTIATALRWALRWKSKDGNDRYLGGMLHRRRRDIESDDLSEIVRHFGDSGTIEKRSSLLAEEMGHAPYLHSDDQLRPMSFSHDLSTEPMEDIDLDPPCAPALNEAVGSPTMLPMPCSTRRLTVRNIDPDEYEKAKTLPKSWVADRALANIANWPRPPSVRSETMGSDASLPSPFSAKAASSAADEEWPRSASQCSYRVSSAPTTNANWAPTLRSSLFAAIGGKEDDKYTRPVLPISRSLSRASTGRTVRSSLSAAMSQPHTFGRAGGKGLVIEEEDDNYSISSSARGEMRQALLLSEGKSTVGERYKAYARSLRSRDGEA